MRWWGRCRKAGPMLPLGPSSSTCAPLIPMLAPVNALLCVLLRYIPKLAHTLVILGADIDTASLVNPSASDMSGSASAYCSMGCRLTPHCACAV